MAIPIKPPVLNTFNQGEAIAQGNRNALAEQQIRAMPERQQMAREQHQTQQAGAQMQQALQGLDYMIKSGRMVGDQASYEGWIQDLAQKGIIDPTKVKEQWTPEHMNQILGRAGAQLQIGKYNPKDYTTKSWTEFLKSRNPSVLKRYETSMTERIALDPNLAKKVETTQAGIAGGKAGASEQAKSEIQLAMRPKITRAVKKAEALAKAKGETLTSLARAQAALPGLKDVVAKLGILADTGTHTMTGKGFDVLVKELGFGSTKGATARAKMTAIVNNQVLPLLRDTFGAAFTVAEGESLRATLLDVDAAPEQKKATLNAFLDQKVRDIKTKEREASNLVPEGATQTQAPPATQSTQSAIMTHPQTGKRYEVDPITKQVIREVQ